MEPNTELYIVKYLVIVITFETNLKHVDEGGEVAGFLVDQLTRVLVSPGWIQSPARSLSTPSNLGRVYTQN